MKKRLLIILSMLVGLWVPMTSAWAGPFKDTAGQWWEQPIAECYAADLLSGKSAGIFAPKSPVTRLESVVILNRALGHRSEADTYSMSQGGYNFPANFPEWGKKNVAFAADQGYISKAGIASMEPKHSASRTEIAVLFANALKLSADGYELTFADKSAIPSNLQSYVAAAVKHGIMVGKAGNKFDPNASVTRGEMAAIIARLFENGQINPNPDQYFVAAISSIDTAAKKITVVKGGQTLTYSLAADSVQYRNGAQSNLSSFKAGENAKIVLNDSKGVSFLAYTTASPSAGNISITTNYTGTIRGLISGNPWSLSFQPDSGTLNSYPLLSTVKITQGGAAKDLTALTNGARAEIKVTGGSVAEINLLNTVSGNETKAYVVNMYLDYMTVRYDDGTTQEINKSSVASGFYQMPRGQRIAISKTGGVITGITPLDEVRKIFGEVVNTGSSGITIEDLDGYERAVDLASGYRVKDEEGDTIDLDDLEKGDEVEIEINSQEDAVTIRLTDGGSSSSSDLEGEVMDVDTSGDYSIKIKKANGSTKTYDVEDDVDVYDEDDDDLDFDEIDEGDYVKLKLDSNDDVTRINILDVEVLEGEVTELDTSGSLGITIEDSDGDEEDYEVLSKVDVWEDSKSRDFDDIREGDRVRLILNEDGDVYLINILDEDDSDDDDGTYKGTLVGLDIDDDELKLKKSGKTTTYTLARKVEVDDGDLELDELIIGCEVEIEVEDGEVETIEVTDDEDIEIEGELYRIGSDHIQLEQENGSDSPARHKFYFDDDADLEDDEGDSIDIDDLEDFEGDDVAIELEDGKIVYLEVK
ncbi:S-layer homology domain-containing protein [Desulforamulus ruminis]|uniref:S-layer domain-containing protein n=1 Tax=Desulforamulus ruminis (strain ATCC 23193 / DSM 2154 / NCIMB 8452 / DL) TaxID=696281 RepID=F6DTA7_DESRL|nr:S-layer homology domain-containing protein [Desulforamulus ruminis]AEG58924.1 S-layer domain-containing protein [Desulforamulus ruminis DSM 2154]